MKERPKDLANEKDRGKGSARSRGGIYTEGFQRVPPATTPNTTSLITY
jgi:hypothetical protein